MKPAVAHIQILTCYSTFVQTNVSQLQSFCDQRASHMSVTLLTHVSCVMTHSCMGHDSIMYGMTDSHVCHMSITLYMPSSILHIWHDSFLRETWLNHMWLICDSHVTASCHIWLSHDPHRNESWHMRHESKVWLICDSNVSHVSVTLYTTTSILHIWHDSFLRETWLNHMWLTCDSHVTASHMPYHIGHMNESRVTFAIYTCHICHICPL